MTERELQSAVIELARLQQWLVAHFRPARTEQGWRTPVEADGKGFPDLVMVRRDRLIFAELKTDTGKLTADQERWIDMLYAVDVAHSEDSACPEVYVWRPSHWTSGRIERLLA